MSGSESDRPALGGVLGELFGDVVRTESVPHLPVHPRMLTVAGEDGPAFVFACWHDPGGDRALHAALLPLVEASLLLELSRPPSELAGEGPVVPARLLLAVFEDVAGDLDAAVASFGFRRAPPEGEAWRAALASLRGEAQGTGHAVLDEPVACFEARVARVGGDRGELVEALEARLAHGAGDEVFGAAPGRPFRRFGAALAELGGEPPTPDGAGLDLFERVLAQGTPGALRWIEPACFQALCDAVGVAAVKAHGADVQWAPCEPDEHGVAPPPMLRLARDDGHVHLPVGLHVLRWLVMPLSPGEDVPRLSEWLAAELAS